MKQPGAENEADMSDTQQPRSTSVSYKRTMKSKFKRNKYLLLGKLTRGNVLQEYGRTGVSNQKLNNPGTNMKH
jgi:hypothetical protein